MAFPSMTADKVLEMCGGDMSILKEAMRKAKHNPMAEKKREMREAFDKMVETFGENMSLKRFRAEAVAAYKRAFPDEESPRKKNPYLEYMSAHLPKVRDENPGKTYSEHRAIVTQMYNNLKGGKPADSEHSGDSEEAKREKSVDSGDSQEANREKTATLTPAKRNEPDEPEAITPTQPYDTEMELAEPSTRRTRRRIEFDEAAIIPSAKPTRRSTRRT